MDSFRTAFGCKPGDKVVREGDSQIRIWQAFATRHNDKSRHVRALFSPPFASIGERALNLRTTSSKLSSRRKCVPPARYFGHFIGMGS